MTWIKTIRPEDADDSLKAVYSSINSARKNIANIHLVQSLNPAALEAHFELYKAVVFTNRNGLPRITKERIGVLVSHQNSCNYCKRHHGEALRQLGEPTAERLELEEGKIPMHLPEEERSMLRWVVRIANQPNLADPQDIRELREIGYDDPKILDIVLTISYFSFVNRLALLTGVGLEPWFAETCGPLEGSPEDE